MPKSKNKLQRAVATKPSKKRLRIPSTGCPTKNDTLFWRAVAPLNFELGIKVGGVLESSGSQL